MTIIYLLIPLSLVMLGVAIGLFVWALRNGQYDDLDTPALDILRDESNDDTHAQRESTDGQ